MYPTMVPKSFNLSARFGCVLICALGSSTSLSFGSPEDEQVSLYLREQGMLSILEVQLEDRISKSNGDEQEKLILELSGLYLEEIRALEIGTLEEQALVLRAQMLIERMQNQPLYELRLELCIREFQALESKIELARLLLIDHESVTESITRLKSIQSKLRLLINQIQPDLDRENRVLKKKRNSNTNDARRMINELQRFASLSHYYSGWVGYSLASMQSQHVPERTFKDFAMLLGSDGDLPQGSLLNESTLEYDHVARSAIGIALSYAQSDDIDLAERWIDRVIQSEYVSEEIRKVAQHRHVQILVMNNRWTDVHTKLKLYFDLEGDTDVSELSIPDTRYIAIHSLDTIQGNRGKSNELRAARSLADQMIKHLIAQKEIGHVLDLFSRYEQLPELEESFVGFYARGIVELGKRERSNDTLAHSFDESISLFTQALGADDAQEFERERDDCLLKLAYCFLRANRPEDSIEQCILVLDSSKDHDDRAQVVEEARWIRISALSALKPGRETKFAQDLELAVKEYIELYPTSPKSAKLLMIYAANGTLEPEIAIQTLNQIQDDDPIVIPARRMLIGLMYKESQIIGHRDNEQTDRIIELIDWVFHSDDSNEDIGSTISLARIGLDLEFRKPEPRAEFIHKLIQRAQHAIEQDPKLGVHRSELVYREVQLAILQVDDRRAMELIQSLQAIDESKASSAMYEYYVRLAIRWRNDPIKGTAIQLIKIGPNVLSDRLPSPPTKLDVQTTQVAELLIEVFDRFPGLIENDHEIAVRYAHLLIERGSPSESGLRLITKVSHAHNQYQLQLDAWLILLSIYPSSDDRWFEARYESIRAMLEIDPIQARMVYQQFELLYPSLGPEPWASQYPTLIGRQISDPDPESGESP